VSILQKILELNKALFVLHINAGVLKHRLVVYSCIVRRSKKFLDFDTEAVSFLFDKHCSIMEQLGLKDSSRDLHANCVISFCFHLYLMLEKFFVFG
jgi:hypothetical protein